MKRLIPGYFCCFPTVLIFILSFNQTAFAQPIYRWVDAQGRVHFSAREQDAPPGSAELIELEAIAPPAAQQRATQTREQAIETLIERQAQERRAREAVWQRQQSQRAERRARQQQQCEKLQAAYARLQQQWQEKRRRGYKEAERKRFRAQERQARERLIETNCDY